MGWSGGLYFSSLSRYHSDSSRYVSKVWTHKSNLKWSVFKIRSKSDFLQAKQASVDDSNLTFMGQKGYFHTIEDRYWVFTRCEGGLYFFSEVFDGRARWTLLQPVGRTSSWREGISCCWLLPSGTNTIWSVSQQTAGDASLLPIHPDNLSLLPCDSWINNVKGREDSWVPVRWDIKTKFQTWHNMSAEEVKWPKGLFSLTLDLPVIFFPNGKYLDGKSLRVQFPKYNCL